MLMTSWAVVCDIKYLEPTTIKVIIIMVLLLHIFYQWNVTQENETAIEFASRIKTAICREGGLVDLEWLACVCVTDHV